MAILPSFYNSYSRSIIFRDGLKNSETLNLLQFIIRNIKRKLMRRLMKGYRASMHVQHTTTQYHPCVQPWSSLNPILRVSMEVFLYSILDKLVLNSPAALHKSPEVGEWA